MSSQAQFRLTGLCCEHFVSEEPCEFAAVTGKTTKRTIDPTVFDKESRA